MSLLESYTELEPEHKNVVKVRTPEVIFFEWLVGPTTNVLLFPKFLIWVVSRSVAEDSFDAFVGDLLI